MKLFIEGKAKKIFSSKDKHTLVQYFKDDATAFNNKKKNNLKVKEYLIIVFPLWFLNILIEIE